ncbi:MAG: hypothetical protein ACI8P0_001118 [Planctomycetaceae bacterium]|jgi:hypothetical protein
MAPSQLSDFQPRHSRAGGKPVFLGALVSRLRGNDGGWIAMNYFVRQSLTYEYELPVTI